MSAAVLSFPEQTKRTAKRRLGRVELDARHSWMMSNYSNWDTTAIDGVDYPAPGVAMLMTILDNQLGDEFPRLTVERMQSDIHEKRKVIVKRNQAKAWLQALGADVNKIKTAEDALFFVVDYLQAQQA